MAYWVGVARPCCMMLTAPVPLVASPRPASEAEAEWLSWEVRAEEEREGRRQGGSSSAGAPQDHLVEDALAMMARTEMAAEAADDEEEEEGEGEGEGEEEERAKAGEEERVSQAAAVSSSSSGQQPLQQAHGGRDSAPAGAASAAATLSPTFKEWVAVDSKDIEPAIVEQRTSERPAARALPPPKQQRGITGGGGGVKGFFKRLFGGGSR